MAIQDFLQRTFWGNTLENYAWLAGIILFGLIFKRIISKVLSILLFKFFKRFAAEVKGEKFVELLVRPIELMLLFLTIYLAVNHLDYPLDELILRKGTITYGFLIDKLFQIGIVFSVTWIVLRIIDFAGLVMLYKASLTESKSDDQLVPFIKESLKLISVIISVFFILGAIFKLNVASLIAGLGIGGLAIALAAKESLENLLGSFTIFLDKPFVVGDLIKVEGIEGTVENVGFRSTRIRTMDKSIITLPNKKMVDSAMDNLTLRSYRRVKFNIGLSYDTPKETLMNITAEIQNYLNQREHISSDDSVVIFENFGEYSLNLMILYFVEIMEYKHYLMIKEEINYKIMDIVKEKGAKIAYPVQQVLLEQESES